MNPLDLLSMAGGAFAAAGGIFNWDWIIASIGPLLLALVGAFFGYTVHAAKSFREQKQQAHKEILVPIVKMVYDRENAGDDEYNQALLKL